MCLPCMCVGVWCGVVQAYDCVAGWVAAWLGAQCKWVTVFRWWCRCRMSNGLQMHSNIHHGMQDALEDRWACPGTATQIRLLIEYSRVWCRVVSGALWCGVEWCTLVWSWVVYSGVVMSGVLLSGHEWCTLVWSCVVYSCVVLSGVLWCGLEWCTLVWWGVVSGSEVWLCGFVDWCSGLVDVVM